LEQQLADRAILLDVSRVTPAEIAEDAADRLDGPRPL